MSRLSQRAEELVREGRAAGRSTEDDRERVLAALRARLGDGPVLGRASTQAQRRVTKPVWLMVAIVVGLGAGAALALTMRGEPRPAAPKINPIGRAVLEAPPAPPAETAGFATATPPAASAAEPSSVVEPATTEPSSAAARPPRDRLAQEVAILSRATSYLEAGRAADALRAVEEHQRKFPNGLLTEERYAARVQALCALGRRDEAASDLAHLSRMAPESPQLSRASQACAAAPAAPSAANPVKR